MFTAKLVQPRKDGHKLGSTVDHSLLITLSGACRLLGISRPTAGKWIKREMNSPDLCVFLVVKASRAIECESLALLDWMS